MRVVNDKNGNYVRTENVTAPPPASGMFCARDEKGVPVALAARQHEQQLKAEAAAKKESRRSERDKQVEAAPEKASDTPAAATTDANKE